MGIVERTFEKLRAMGLDVEAKYFQDINGKQTLIVEVDDVMMTMERAEQIADGRATMAQAREAARATN